jgi:rRNA maturation endonuclease Nob1
MTLTKLKWVCQNCGEEYEQEWLICEACGCEDFEKLTRD